MLVSVEQRLGEMGGNGNNGILGTSGALFLDAGSTRASFSAAHNNLTGCGGNAEEKQVALWERRIGTLRKLVKSFDQTSKFYYYFELNYYLLFVFIVYFFYYFRTT